MAGKISGPHWRGIAFATICSVGAVLLSWAALKFLKTPFLWIFPLWASVFLIAAVRIHKVLPSGSLLLFNAGVLFLLLEAGEAYLSVRVEKKVVYSTGYQRSDAVLGWAANKGVQAHSTRTTEDGSVIYSVNYTIDSAGLRVAWPRQTPGSSCILVFGDSYVFGEGLEDHETLTYQLEAQSAGKFRVFNLAFHGYGPNQMLAALEAGYVRKVVDCEPDYIFYQTLPHGILRAAGRIPYGQSGPRYVLGPNGQPQFTGSFETNYEFSDRMKRKLDGSAVYRFVEDIRSAKYTSSISEDEITLYMALIRRSRELLAAHYPKAKFALLLWKTWSHEEPLYTRLATQFREKGMTVHAIHDVLPDFTVDSPKYWISKSDRHPNALGNRSIAKHLLDNVLD